MRYDQLLTLIALYKPSSIIEVGSNKGDRAVAMCQEALKHNGHISYTGYDVFDTKDDDFHETVFNGKGFFAKEFVHNRLQEIVQKHVNFRFELVEGMTQDTLQKKRITADLVFIDGDHRADAIVADYHALKNSKVVVFDDFYVAVEGCGSIDTSKFGCNALVEKLPGAVILPLADRFPHAGDIHMAAKIRRHFFFGRKIVWL